MFVRIPIQLRGSRALAGRLSLGPNSANHSSVDARRRFEFHVESLACSTRCWPAASGPVPHSISPAAPMVFGTSSKMSWPWSTAIRPKHGLTFFAPRRGSSKRATLSIGGTRRREPASAHESPTTSTSCRWPYTTTLLQRAISNFSMNECRYIKSPVLREGQEEAFNVPSVSDERAPSTSTASAHWSMVTGSANMACR